MIQTARYFAGIGAAKAGTSWLATYLGGHPEVALSPIKELHYFDAMYLDEAARNWNRKWRRILDELEEKYRTDPQESIAEKLRCVQLRLRMIEEPAAYSEYFTRLVQPGHRAFGEVTPAYGRLDREGFAAMLDLYPDARFIYMVRDPVDRYLSQVRFLKTLRHKRGRGDGGSFEADQQALKHLDNPALVDRGDYQHTLETLYSLVPEDRCLVVFYEQLFASASSQRVVGEICDFLELSEHAADIEARVNESDSLLFSENVIAKVRQRLTPVYDYMAGRYGGALPDAWRG